MIISSNKKRFLRPMSIVGIAFVLTACGGGSSDPSDTALLRADAAQPASIQAARSNKVTSQAPAQNPAATWTLCGAEWPTASVGAVCTFSGIHQVRYGANNTYAYKTAAESIACNNDSFGDPIPGVPKQCEYASEVLAATAPTTAPATADAPSASSVYNDNVFAASSFWYQAIPASAPLHANSANYVNEFQRQRQTYYNTVNINTTSYASPVYVVDSSVPAVTVSFWDCQNKGYAEPGLVAQWSAVPIPSYAVPADGTDAEMTVYQPSTGTIWEFWGARKVNGSWQACWGGQMKQASTSSGIWTNPYGTTATGLPFIGGQITAAELARGEIRHAIGISLVDLENWNVFSWPANRSDGYNPTNAANRIPEGTRFRLNPNINVDALPLHPVGKMIAKAAQKYGFVVWDKAGTVSLRFENPKAYTVAGKPDPFISVLNGAKPWEVLYNFPWDQLQFMPFNYGKP